MGIVRSLVLHFLIVTACFLALSGCSKSSGGGGITQIISPSSIEDIVVTPGVESTLISFSVVSPDLHPMSVSVEISENRGISYREAALTSGETTGLTSAATGERYEIVWNTAADLNGTDQADLIVRITPQDDLTGLTGSSGMSKVFNVGTNSAPMILSVDTPLGPQGGEILFAYVVRDKQSDYIGLLLEFSLDSGNSWNDAIPGSSGDGTTAVSTTDTKDGVQRSVSWNAQANAGGYVSSTVRLRITPIDVTTGGAGESLDFTVNLIGPTLDLFTLGTIPSYMNGSEPYQKNGADVHFTIAAPKIGSRLRMEYDRAIGGGEIDLDSVKVTADKTVGEYSSGSNLGGFFVADTELAVWTVDDTLELPLGEIELTATISDEFGNVSEARTLPLIIVEGNAAERPFDWVDTWHLDFSTDHYAVGATGSTTKTFQITLGGNSVADYEEDLILLGLRTNSLTSAAKDLDTNAIVLQLVKEETLGRLREIYGKDFDGDDAGFQENLVFTLDATDKTSAIRIGGDDAGPGVAIGRAQFDHRNVGPNTDISATLGVFTTNMIQYYINSSYTFKGKFDVLIPGRGTPVGEHSADHVVLDSDFDRLDTDNTFQENQRYDFIWVAIEAWGRAVAVIAAHEIGHSIGLCRDGNPPSGHFGGVTEPSFTGGYTSPYHCDTPGNNVMAAALSFSASVRSGVLGYRFNELNEAYLREWMVLNR